MLQESEIVSLLLGAFALVILLTMLRRTEMPSFPAIYAGFGFVLLAYFFAVAEGFAYQDTFDFLERECLALAGLAFAAGCWRLCRRSRHVPSGES